MTPATLSRIGTVLYGQLWQTQLARALGINDRTVRRFLAGEMAIPDGLQMELVDLLHKRRRDMEDAISDLLSGRFSR